MENKKSYLEKILMDVDGQPSSKRLITLISFVLISAAFIVTFSLKFH